MVQLVTAENRAEHSVALDHMHRDRKKTFVDLLKWKIPCDGEFERDQFDDDFSEYLILADPETAEHLGSMRLLRTERPHILGTLFPVLCDQGVPAGPDIREITRLCFSRHLKAADRRLVFHRLVTALAEYALLCGITAYTAVSSMHWLNQTLALGWRCTPLGLPQMIDGELVCAVMIHIDRNTIQLLRDAGSYQTSDLRLAEAALAAAA